MGNKKKIWVDSTQDVLYGIERLSSLVEEGNTLCVGTTFLDCAVFQRNPDIAETWLKTGKLVIEPTEDLSEMTSKEFYWSSCDLYTPAVGDFSDVLEILPTRDFIEKLAHLFETYKSNWEPGPIQAPVPIAYNYCERLGLPYDRHYRRSNLLKITQGSRHEQIFNPLNKLYISSIAMQHCCTAAIIDGKVEEIA